MRAEVNLGLGGPVGRRRSRDPGDEVEHIAHARQVGRVGTLRRDELGRLWLAGDGVHVWDEAGGLHTPTGFPELGRVTSVAPLPDGRVALACALGIVVVSLP